MDGITLSIFFGTALGVVGAWILISITESKLWKKWMSKLDLCIERTSEPKSPLDREIAEEEKEIKFLTEQKAKIDRLRALKREKDRLYQEVETDAQKEDVDGYRCPQCGSTKVSGSSRIYRTDLYNHVTTIEHCSDCATPINERERVK